jgi:hypothetical protein
MGLLSEPLGARCGWPVGCFGGGVRARKPLARIPRMDWADRTEGRGNAGGTASSFFHPSGPSEFGYLIQRKSLI